MNQYASLSAFPENLAALRDTEGGGPAAGHPEQRQPRDDRGVGAQCRHDRPVRPPAVVAGTSKPSRPSTRIYALGPAGLRLRAREILFVSSNCWDAIAARWYGYTSFWINRAGVPLEQLDTDPITPAAC